MSENMTREAQAGEPPYVRETGSANPAPRKPWWLWRWFRLGVCDYLPWMPHWRMKFCKNWRIE